MFITAEDFNINPYRLPNLDANEDFASYVDQEEQSVLKKILGRTLYDAFIAACFTEADGVFTAKDDADIDQRWKDLRDGVDYRYNNKTYHWDGMFKTLKPYIYAKWTIITTDSHSGAGIVIPIAENADVISPAQRIVRGWNEFALYVGNQSLLKDTLYGYLYNSADTFLDDIGEDYTSITAYLSDRFEDPGTMNTLNL
jgi:hypothetical protein